MNKRKNVLAKGFVKLLFTLTLFLCSFVFADPVYLPPRKVIKVGVYHMGDYFKVDKVGNVDSYDSAYLEKIALYTNYKFEYVDCKSWTNALEMLNNKQIDLIGAMQWTLEREDLYEYCLESYGYTISEFVANESSKLIFEDYDEIAKSTIGMTYNYIRKNEALKVLDSHGITPKIKYYKGQEELENALNYGDVQIIVLNSHAAHSELKVLERFNFAPFYFISWKGNESLVDSLDDAIIRIKLEFPNFTDNLTKKYFPEIRGTPLSKAEETLIAENKVYTVLLTSNSKPLCWYDEETNAMKGAFIEVCNQIEEISGLKLKFKNMGNATPEEIRAMNASFSIIYYNSVLTLRRPEGLTDSLMDEPFNMFSKLGSKFDETQPYRVATVGSRWEVGAYINEKYSHYEVIPYASADECLKHLNKGDVDLAFLSVHVANDVIIRLNLNSIQEIPRAPVLSGMGIQFYGGNAKLLASIVNKSLFSVDRDAVNNALLQYALETSPEFSLISFISQHIVATILCVGFMILLFVVIAVLATNAHVIKKQSIVVQNANQAKSDFYARMSHDMRTPMNGILGMTDLSENEQNIEVLHKNIAKIKESGTYLLGLINDSLDLQKIENGKLQLVSEIICTKDLVASIVNMITFTAQQKNIDFTVVNKDAELNSFICCDIQRIRQIFINLLSNAVKFTPERGSIQCIIERLSQTDSILHDKIQVIDSGIGISKEFLEKGIFSPYAQERNAMTTQYAGSGLGLAIAKSLVELMHGKIEVESELGEGTAFTIYLDFKKPTDDEIKNYNELNNKTKTEDYSKLKGKHFLLCEDHPLNAEIAIKMLEKVGATADWAKNGQEALEIFKKSEKNYYDVIIMDIRMPVMNGLDAAQAIRKASNPDAKTIPIVAMSANAYSEDIEKSLSVGMNAHLAKPIDTKAFYTTLSSFF